MSDFTPGLPTQKTLVFTDNNGRQFSADLTVNPGTAGADGDPSGTLPLTGGTVSGSLSIDDGAAHGPWSAGPAFVRQLGDKQFYEYGQLDGGGNIQLLMGSVNGPAPFAFCPSLGIIISPYNRPYVEDAGGGLKPVFIQRFTVQGFNGSYITFPQSFSSDDVRVIIPSFYDGANFITCGTTRQHPPTRNGFTLSKWSAGPAAGWDGQTDAIDIIAIGEG